MNSADPEVPLYGTEKTTEKPFAIASTLYSGKAAAPQVATATVLKIALLVLGVALLVYAIYRVLPVLLLVFIAIMLATAIEPVVNNLRRGPFSRSQGILLVYTGIFAVLVIIAWLIIPVFITQIGEVMDNLPTNIKNFQEWAATVHTPFLRDQAANAANALNQVFSSTQGAPTTAPAEQVASVSSVVLSLAEGFLSVIVVFVMAFYWMTERTHIKRWMVSLLPADRGNRVRRVWDEIEVTVGSWVRGQLTLMGLIGLISAVGYFGIGVRYWPALALFIAIAEAIPMVGPYIGTAPAVLIALTQPENDGLMSLLGVAPLNPLLRAGLVVVFAIILQTVEGNILLPRVMRNAVGISPLTVLLSLLIGAALAGLAGALLAVPLAGALQVVIIDLQTSAVARAEQEKRAATEEAQKAVVAQLILPTDSPVAISVSPGQAPKTEVIAPGPTPEPVPPGSTA
jgi:predicted PurR-regulated permease PerM